MDGEISRRCPSKSRWDFFVDDAGDDKFPATVFGRVVEQVVHGPCAKRVGKSLC